MTTVLIAPDGFKGSIPAAGAAAALAAGWRDARPGDRVIQRPMADGGEGTLDALASAAVGARRMPLRVTGPHGRAVMASWLLLPPTDAAPHGTGAVELASTSGIELLGAERRPFDADTRGFGEAILAALDHGVSRLVLGIGSSASTDAGFGALRALGARITDAAGTDVPPGLRGLGAAVRLDRSALRPPPPGGAVVLTDVRSPLTGPAGAAAVFGPQKGLASADVAAADAALARAAELLGIRPDLPGAGAAGGTGAALHAWGAELVGGAERVADLVGLGEAIAVADVVITGEGAFDAGSAAGKAPERVAALAGGRPVLLAAGRITADTAGFADTVALTSLAGSAAAALADPARWLRAAGRALGARYAPNS